MSPGEPPRTWPLVGRRDELRSIGDALRLRTSSGVVVTGPPGTGKTRLALEAADLARSVGIPHLVVSATRAAGTIPLGAFARLLPHLDDRSPAGVSLMAEARNALLSHALRGRLVLVVDDAHLLDPVSAALVLELTLGGDVFAILTIRVTEPPPDAIAAVWKDGHTRRLDLDVLSQRDTIDLVEQHLGASVDSASADRLWRVSGGNPLYLRELVTHALERRALTHERGLWVLAGATTVPRSIHELVGARLAGLAAGQRRALDVVALAEEIGLATLRELHPDADIEQLERLELIGVAHDGRRRRVRLAHPLYGEVIRATLPVTTTTSIAATLADLVQSIGARRREDPLRVATWHLEAGTTADPALMLTAARQAYRAGDFSLAERLVRAPFDGTPDPQAKLLLAQLLDERGAHDAVERELASVDLTRLPRRLRVTSALLRSDTLFFGLGREQEAFAVLEGAEHVVGPDLSGELRANRAWLELHAGRPGVAWELAGPVRGHRDEGARVAAGIVSSRALGLLGRTSDALEIAEEASAIVDAAGGTAERHRDFPEIAAGYALLFAGRLGEANELADDGHTRALTSRPPFLVARWATLLGWVQLERGQLGAAAAAFREAAAIQARIGQHGLLRWPLAGQALATAQMGHVQEARAAIAELEEVAAGPQRLFEPAIIRSRAWTEVATGHRTEGARLLACAADVARRSGSLIDEAACLHDLVRIGAEASAAERLSELTGQTDSALVQLRAAHAEARRAGDGHALDAAATGLAGIGATLLAAEAHAHAALAHRAERRSRASRRVAEELAAGCAGARTPALLVGEPAGDLTTRELEVVTLAAGGGTSREIAEELVISVRTVNNLLQRAYTKLGVHSRAEAAAALDLRPDRAEARGGAAGR